MSTFAERLKAARIARGLSQLDLANAADVTKQSISAIEIGKTTTPEHATIIKIARKVRKHPKWLLEGTGPESIDEDEYNEWKLTSGLAIRDGEPDYRYKAPSAGYVRLELMEDRNVFRDDIFKDLYPEVLESIDIAAWRVQQQLGFIPTDNRVQLLTVRGNSNYPKIKNGDVVMVDTSQASFSGDDFYLIIMHGHALIKRLQIMGDGMHIRSTNPEYESEVVPANALADLIIAGRILGLAQFRRSEEI